MKDMKEEIIAAIVMYVIGFCLLFVPSIKIWYITENGRQHSFCGSGMLSFALLTTNDVKFLLKSSFFLTRP